MVAPVTFLYKEGDTKAMEDEAKWILEALDIAYPGHPWWVRVYDGGFFIRHLDFDGNHGMNCKKKFASASEMKREVIMKAGEWLERAGLRRGMGDPDQEPYRVDGVPERFQHVKKEKQINIEALIDAGKKADHEMRPLAIPKPM